MTAELPTLEEILQWQEGQFGYDHGYYRFVDHPFIYELKQRLCSYYQVRNCLIYNSFRSALSELLEYLLQGQDMVLKIIEEPEATSDLDLDYLTRLLPCNVRLIERANWQECLPFEGKRKEVLMLALERPLDFCETLEELIQQSGAAKVPVIAVTEDPPPVNWNARFVKYWVSALNRENNPCKAGMLLSNADRQMAELHALHKQRGPVLSSRNAAVVLGREKSPVYRPATEEYLVRRLCQMERADHGLLFPSGMNAIASLFSLLRHGERQKIVCIGHLYTDTYAMLAYDNNRRRAESNVFLGVDELDRLEEVLDSNTAAIITETITNPLNDVPDLDFIAQTALYYEIPLIVDNTFATPFNCNPLNWGADFVVYSTTKHMSGLNDHAGGAVILNNQDFMRELRGYQYAVDNRMSPLEMEVLLDHLQDFEMRMGRFNRNALQIAQFLEDHPAVDTVFFNGLSSHRCYSTAQRLLRGHGSVISFTLVNQGREGLSRFYDFNMEGIGKAPSLGGNQTMICPYTLLAHYHESDEMLDSLGISRWLVRISVGCEDEITPVIDNLDLALSATL